MHYNKSDFNFSDANTTSSNRSVNTTKKVSINLTSICFLIFAVLAVLKLCGVITLSWALVCIPLWIALGLFVLSLIIVVLLLLVFFIIALAASN